MQEIHHEISEYLKTDPNQASLTDFLNNMRPKVRPALQWSQIDPSKVAEPIAVYARLMVQDIRDIFYYYSFVMKKPFTEKYYLKKYGNEVEVPEDALDDPNYLKVMTDQQQVICMPVRFTTKWVKAKEGRTNQMDTIKLGVDGRWDFKLGETRYLVAIYHPKHKRLFYVRDVSAEEVSEQHLDPLRTLTLETTDFVQKRQLILNFFMRFCSQKYAYFLLFSLISKNTMFISADNNLQPAISLIHPYVNHVRIKSPFKGSLFPYKNSEDELVLAPMQMSNESTYVILDFSQFSQKSQIKIDQSQIDNIKALKVFVEDATTIYRWQFGESTIKHEHSGIIVKASSMIIPQYNLKDEKTTLTVDKLSDVSEESLEKMRRYLLNAKKVEAILDEEQRGKIQDSITEEITAKTLDANLFKQKMEVAKLLAQSQGSSVIKLQDFVAASKLLEG